MQMSKGAEPIGGGFDARKRSELCVFQLGTGKGLNDKPTMLFSIPDYKLLSVLSNITFSRKVLTSFIS